jgi:4-hydroxy-2-oxoglutarate aldolase
MADHPNIVGIKDTSKTMMASYLAVAGGREDFTIMAGSIGNLRACLLGGGAGGICSAANYLPDQCAEIYTLYAAGMIDQAWAKLEAIRHLAAATAGRFSVAGVKAAMSVRGFAPGIPRLPILSLPDADVAHMARAFQEID